jgi:hypothetical protein
MAGIEQAVQSSMPLVQKAMQAIQKGADPKSIVPEVASQIGTMLGGEQVGQIAGQVAGQVMNKLG